MNSLLTSKYFIFSISLPYFYHNFVPVSSSKIGETPVDGGNWTGSSDEKRQVVSETKFSSAQTASRDSFLEQVLRSNSSQSYFKISDNETTFTIISEYTPIIYNNVSYYWDGYYEPDYSTKMWECRYSIGDDDLELNQVIFENGTKPGKLIFGCSGEQFCCGLDCCPDVKVLYAVLLISIFVVLFFLNRCCEKYGCCQYEGLSAISAPLPEDTPNRRLSITPISETPSPRTPEPRAEGRLTSRTLDPMDMKSVHSTEIETGLEIDRNNDNSIPMP